MYFASETGLAFALGCFGIFVGGLTSGKVWVVLLASRKTLSKICWDWLVSSNEHFSEFLWALTLDEISDTDADNVQEGLNIQIVCSLFVLLV